jgi:hypothetical protein
MKYGFTILGEGSKSNDVFNLTRDAISAKQKVLKKQGKVKKNSVTRHMDSQTGSAIYYC